jgi:hypothetical protein
MGWEVLGWGGGEVEVDGHILLLTTILSYVVCVIVLVVVGALLYGPFNYLRQRLSLAPPPPPTHTHFLAGAH